ncbi:MAG: hypothetical protein GY851_12825, partial [bacterium]|nr:hypothetical protein [bacterium]
MIVFPYESVYLGLLRMYDVPNDRVDIELASSRNAKRWDRLIRDPFIPCSPEKGTWDYGNNSPSTDPPVRVGDELWFYYCGRSTTHDETPNRGSIGLGTLRVDGFVSMRAGDEGGVLTTKPLRLDGDTLFINANATGGGIRVEVLDEDGAVMAPFSHNRCVEVAQNGVRIPVRWQDAEVLGELKDRPVQLRCLLQNAEIYAFWTE